MKFISFNRNANILVCEQLTTETSTKDDFFVQIESVQRSINQLIDPPKEDLCYFPDRHFLETFKNLFLL